MGGPATGSGAGSWSGLPRVPHGVTMSSQAVRRDVAQTSTGAIHDLQESP
jgi:hypothetical protein